MKILHIIKRAVPKSILWQEQAYNEAEDVEHVEVANELPDDMPTVEDWYRIRVWTDELEGRSLTN